VRAAAGKLCRPAIRSARALAVGDRGFLVFLCPVCRVRPSQLCGLVPEGREQASGGQALVQHAAAQHAATQAKRHLPVLTMLCCFVVAPLKWKQRTDAQLRHDGLAVLAALRAWSLRARPAYHHVASGSGVSSRRGGGSPLAGEKGKKSSVVFRLCRSLPYIQRAAHGHRSSYRRCVRTA
jgi:hypothetical protein